MQTQQLSKIICLMGPTGSGKTQCALKIATHLPCEIISVDSAAVYCGMDLGTAKPSVEERSRIPHHLIDICDPRESYSAGRFREDALSAIKTILASGKTPLLVGGTMLYFKSLLCGLSCLPTAQPDMRAEIAKEGQAQGWPTMHQKLEQIDPQAAHKIHPHDAQRIQRALEVFYLSGKPISRWHAEESKIKLPFDVLSLAIMVEDRKALHVRIEQRFDQMLKAGLVEEVRHLFERGDLHSNLPAIKTVGYHQVWAYLSGELTYEEMRARAIFATRQLAKRQLTWLKNWSGPLNFISSDQDIEFVLRLIQSC